MRIKTQVMTADGFDRSVAEKMPRMKKMEESPTQEDSKGFLSLEEVSSEERREMDSPKPLFEKEASAEPSPASDPLSGGELDVLRLIEDLHTQLLVSTRTQKALELDLRAQQKTVRQLSQENQALRRALEEERGELQKFKAIHAETTYLREENEEALRKIREVQQELRATKENLSRALLEKEEALAQIRELEGRLEQNELVKIKGRMNERELSYFREENRELHIRLEEVLAQKTELEQRYEALKQSFNEIKESLTLLRDSYKKNFYGLTEEVDPS